MGLADGRELLDLAYSAHEHNDDERTQLLATLAIAEFMEIVALRAAAPVGDNTELVDAIRILGHNIRGSR